MKYKEQTKQAAKDLYVKGGKSQRENWEQERASIAISVDTLIPKILAKINSDIDEGNLSADALAKYCKQLRELSKNSLTINDYHQVMVKFSDFLRLQAPKDSRITPVVLQVVTTQQDNFLKSIANED